MLPSVNVTIALRRPVSPLALSVVKPPMARFDAEIVFCDGLDGVVIVPPHAFSETTAANRAIPRNAAFTCVTRCKDHADDVIQTLRQSEHGLEQRDELPTGQQNNQDEVSHGGHPS